MNLLEEALLDHFPSHNIALPAVDTSRHDKLCKQLWDEYGIVAIHKQDQRLSKKHRGFLAYLANNQWGRGVT